MTKKELSVFLLRYLKIIILSCVFTFLLYSISHIKGHSSNTTKRNVIEKYQYSNILNSTYFDTSQEIFFGEEDNGDYEQEDIIYSNTRYNKIDETSGSDNNYSNQEPYLEENFSELADIYTQNTHKNTPLTQENSIPSPETEVKKPDLFNESIVKSKLFSSTMGLSEITPFYKKATENIKKEDISIITLVTSNRMRSLSRLATRYKGPISATIHLNENEQKDRTLEKLHKLFDENIYMRMYVDVHLIVDRYNRQLNMWRNVARLYSRTDYVFMLDVDFYVCTDFRSSVLSNSSMLNLLKSGNGALVIPAFEYISQSDGREWNSFPNKKKELINLVHNKKIDMFHRSWKKGHSATNYKKWYRSSKVYKVTKYNYSYEPYVIFKKETAPWCDERFIGYGANKAACLYEIYISGINYYVLPDDFIIHQTHKYPEKTRRKERLFNKKMYASYREEVCLRYARQFVADGVWNHSLSKNLKTECKKIHGVRNIIKSINR